MGLLFRGIVWFGLYVTLVLLPLGVALIFDPIAARRAPAVEFAVAAGFIAFTLIAFEFALVSRLRAASEPFGTDALMQFHRQMGLVALLFLVIHPLALAGHGASLAMLDPFAGGLAQRTGAIALWTTVLLVATSVCRRRIRLPYEVWQWTHGAIAVVIAAAALAHMLAVGRYTSVTALKFVLSSYAILFVALLLRYRIVRPALLARRPWEVIENRDEGADTRTLRLRPLGHHGFEFQPGQFAWLITGRRPFIAQQHPITLSSSAELPPDRSLELSIKALGDWSREIVPAIATGARVWLDAPYGALTPDRYPAQGFVLIAGGIGITPMRSILLTMRDRNDVRPVLLIYAANRPQRMVFREEIEALERALNLRAVLVFEDPPSGWSGEQGFVTTELLRRYLPRQYPRYQFFVCGPEPMMDSLERSLLALGLPGERISTERFDVG